MNIDSIIRRWEVCGEPAPDSLVSLYEVVAILGNMALKSGMKAVSSITQMVERQRSRQ